MRRVGITLASVFGAGIVAVGIGVVVLVVIAVNSLVRHREVGVAPPAVTCPAVASKTIGGHRRPRRARSPATARTAW